MTNKAFGQAGSDAGSVLSFATETQFDPVNGIAATNVQAAIEELNTDVLGRSEVIFSGTISLHATKTLYNLLVARDAWQVTHIDYTPDIAQGGALTATVVKATGTTAPASATTPMHIAGAIDLNATAHTVQPITLTATSADLLLAAGNRIGLVLSGAMTVGSGLVTIRGVRV